jgi:hypothetical protein
MRDEAIVVVYGFLGRTPREADILARLTGNGFVVVDLGTVPPKVDFARLFDGVFELGVEAGRTFAEGLVKALDVFPRTLGHPSRALDDLRRVLDELSTAETRRRVKARARSHDAIRERMKLDRAAASRKPPPPFLRGFARPGMRTHRSGR